MITSSITAHVEFCGTDHVVVVGRQGMVLTVVVDGVPCDVLINHAIADKFFERDELCPDKVYWFAHSAVYQKVMGDAPEGAVN